MPEDQTDLNGAEDFPEFEGTSRFPLDIDALSKGMDIPEETCVTIIGNPAGSDAFRFGMMKLCQWIEREAGSSPTCDDLHCCTRKNTIHILTDEEDVDYQEAQEMAGLRKFGRAYRKSHHIDMGNLTETKRNELTFRLAKRGAQISAMRGALKALPKPKDDG